MDEKVKASWEKALHPKTLKTNIITASIFSMTFEMLKFASSGVDFDVTEVFGEMISLLRKNRTLVD